MLSLLLVLLVGLIILALCFFVVDLIGLEPRFANLIKAVLVLLALLYLLQDTHVLRVFH